jgi:hypothetical protein
MGETSNAYRNLGNLLLKRSILKTEEEDSMDGGSSRRKIATYAQNNRNTE